MQSFPISFDPNDPYGAKLNSLLGTDLRNPTSFMSQLEARKVPAQGVSISKKPKRKVSLILRVNSFCPFSLRSSAL